MRGTVAKRLRQKAHKLVLAEQKTTEAVPELVKQKYKQLKKEYKNA